MPHPETQIPMARPHPTPRKHDSPNANPNGTAQQSADQCITFLARHVIVMQIHVTHPCKVTCKSFPQWQRIPDATTTTNDDKRRETTTDDDRRRQTTRRRKPSKHSSNPQTPNYKREPFATHSGKRENNKSIYTKKDGLKAKDTLGPRILGVSRGLDPVLHQVNACESTTQWSWVWSSFLPVKTRSGDRDCSCTKETATRSKKLLGAPGIATRSKKLLGAPGIAARSKDATRGSWPYY